MIKKVEFKPIPAFASTIEVLYQKQSLEILLNLLCNHYSFMVVSEAILKLP
jgi:hypothetical protein